MKATKYLISLALVGLFPFGSFAQEEEKKEVKVVPTINPHGRIQYDFDFLNRKDGVSPGKDYSFNGQEFRRVFMSSDGEIYRNIKYKVEVELAGGNIAYRSMYIKFASLPTVGGDLYLGSVPEATSYDMETSSKYNPFVERSMLTNTQPFRWNSGVHYKNFGLLKGKLGVQASYAFNGNHKGGFKDSNLENGSHFVARLTSPIYQNKSKNQLIHLGVNYENRQRTESPELYKLKFRPENHMGKKVTVAFDSLSRQEDLGLEFVSHIGAFSFFAEYELGNYKTVSKDYQVNGYYGAVSYFIFGGRSAYKKGAGTRVKPYSNFCIKEKTFGALELVARYSVLDYSNVVTTGTNDKVNNVTAGFNWYLNSNTRLMYNFVLTDYNDSSNKNKMYANLMRIQVDF